MDQIAAMRTFIKVVECQSFTKAANQLGISVAMASKLMQQLEESLATRLLSRTTRQVNPTEAGQFYYQRSLALLAELEETHSQLTHTTSSRTVPSSSRCRWILAICTSPPPCRCFASAFPISNSISSTATGG